MNRIYIQNNISQALTQCDQASQIFFIPKYYTDIQKNFFQRRFQQIKNQFPQTQWLEQLDDLSNSDTVFAWDAIYEVSAFGSNLSPSQNRLFNELPFAVPDSFTSFRKKAEPFLPDLFKHAIPPIDQDVSSELSYYFDSKQLPSTYFEERNGVVGRDYSTKLSSFLACGALDVKYLFNTIKIYEKEYGANKSTYWLVFELLWREFFYWHYQKHKLKYFSFNGLKGLLTFPHIPDISLEYLRNLETHKFFQCVLNELEETGFISNRMRQLFASYWLNELGLNWQSGAFLFECYLIDYDVYSNYGNWMYLAGVGVDPRGKRHFHIEKQLATYDPSMSYIKRWT